MKRIVIFLVLLIVFAAPNCGSEPVTSAVELGGVLLVLQQLKSQLDSILITADDETAARIRQLKIALGGTIKTLNDTMDHGYGLVNNTRDQVMGNIASVMRQTQDIFQESINSTFLAANDSLANLARILTSLPGINIPTYIYAVTPPEFPQNAHDRHVEVHGFFPDASEVHRVNVQVLFGRHSTTLQLVPDVNNTFSFDLPPESLSEEDTFIQMTFHYPVKHLFGARYSYDNFVAARIYVEREKPFEFSIAVNSGNPNQWATTAPEMMHERADSSRTANNQTFTAPELFSQLINDNLQYDSGSAEFTQITGTSVVGQATASALGGLVSISAPIMSDPIGLSGSPCASGCDSPSGRWSWTPTTLSISLNAPNCPFHWISPGGLQVPYHCSGGTNADFNAMITFRVKRRDVRLRDEVKVQGYDVALGRKKVSDSILLPKNWTSVNIVGKFRNHGKEVQHYARLTSGAGGLLSANDSTLWNAQVSGTSLIISTY